MEEFSKSSSLSTSNLSGSSLFGLEHEVQEFSFLLKVGGEDQTSLFESWEELHPSVFSACSLPSFQQVSGIGRIFVHYLARKEVSSCRLRRARSSLVSLEVGGACLFFVWSSLLSSYMVGSSLLVEDEVENLYVVFEDWRSSVHVH